MDQIFEKRVRKYLFRTLKSLFVAIFIFVVFMGFAHTKSGRPVLAWMGHLATRGSACPLGYDQKNTNEDRIAHRQRMAKAREKRPSAHGRRILNFEMGKLDRSNFLQWISESGGKCNTKFISKFDMECTGPFFGADSVTLWLEFDSHDNLVTLRGLESFKNLSMAQHFFQNIHRCILRMGRTGVIQDNIDQLSQIHAGLLNQTQISAEFKHLRAVARATNMGDDYVVSQEFMVF